MITIKNKEDIKKIAKSSQIASFALREVIKKVRPGITTFDLDSIARRLIFSHGGTPSFIEHKNYPGAICVSINSEVVHGLPSNRTLKKGDVIGIDLGVNYSGFYSDCAYTVIVGKTKSSKDIRLVKTVKLALRQAIKKVIPGNKIGDIEAETGRVLKENGLSPILALSGHGVGYKIHEEPSILSDGRSGEKDVIRPGMVFAIEPMASLRKPEVKVSSDGWTVETKDGSNAAHFEHTIVVTGTGSKVLTDKI